MIGKADFARLSDGRRSGAWLDWVGGADLDRDAVEV
jgi:hypothetical protein